MSDFYLLKSQAEGLQLYEKRDFGKGLFLRTPFYRTPPDDGLFILLILLMIPINVIQD